MENIHILITNAVTSVNSVSKKSRLTLQKIKLGSIIHKRDDGVFYENIIFESCEWRPFLRYETGYIELQNLTKKNSCSIIIKSYEEIEKES